MSHGKYILSRVTEHEAKVESAVSETEVESAVPEAVEGSAVPEAVKGSAVLRPPVKLVTMLVAGSVIMLVTGHTSHC